MIGLAHGSRHPGVAESVESILAAASAETGGPARAAYLDLTEPDLTTVSMALAAEGHTEAVVVPLLFTAAYHSTTDTPQAAQEATAASGVRLIVTPILGTGDDVLEVLAAAAAASGIGDTRPVLLFAVGSSAAAANTAVHDLAARYAARRPGPVRAGFGTVEPRGTAVLDDLGDGAAILPLFVSPGLLLEPMARRAAERGHLLAPALGNLVAPLVVQRYRAVAALVGAAG